MSDRYPPPPDTAENTYLDALFETYAKNYHGDNPNFRYQDSETQLLGPIALASYAPDIGIAMMEFGDVILNQKHLSVRSRELAILAVCSVYEMPFANYAHRSIALNAGFQKLQVEDAFSRKLPLGLDAQEKAVYELSLELASTTKTVPEDSWKRAEGVLGKEVCLRVANVVGVYTHIGIIMRLGNLKAPER